MNYELLIWKNGDTGTGFDLYLGRLCIGYITRLVPAKWREWDCYKIGPPNDAPQYMKDNMASAKRFYEQHESKPWRGWLMTNEDGEEIGWWSSLDEAKKAMKTAAISAAADLTTTPDDFDRGDKVGKLNP